MAFELQKEQEPIPEKKYLVRMPSKEDIPTGNFIRSLKSSLIRLNTVLSEEDIYTLAEL
ncbi:hypothetical protein [Succinivibrio dextrinosolvens]|uniref:hypothetical protein n=1 Tax=Succinivibrio dextrinosolvens TaxID=83771 RepID=UPI0013E9759C|nr:hypothetical protein [Succinivibrio dextrinosolvens]